MSLSERAATCPMGYKSGPGEPNPPNHNVTVAQPQPKDVYFIDKRGDDARPFKIIHRETGQIVGSSVTEAMAKMSISKRLAGKGE